MRKTSQDGGDSTSITSGVDNEMKKSILKPKKTSLKRKPPNFSHDSDDTVIEPLLQKDKDKTDTSFTTKFFIKPITEVVNTKESDKTKLINNGNAKSTSSTAFCGTTESLLSNKLDEIPKTNFTVTSTMHNYMNTNVFNNHNVTTSNVTTKNQILVEIDKSNAAGYSPSPLIFTTAKIHMDGNTKNMEPVQITPVPILSTIEVSVSKTGNILTNEKKIGNGSSHINTVYTKSLQSDKNKNNSKGTDSATLSTSIKESNQKCSTTLPDNKQFNKTLVINNAQNISPATSKSNAINNTYADIGFNKSLESADCTKDVIKSTTAVPEQINVTDSSKLDTGSSNSAVNKSVLDDMPKNSLNTTDVAKTKNQQQYNYNTQSIKTDNATSSTNSSNDNIILGNKQLQRQKIVNEDTLDLKHKLESVKEPSAKINSAKCMSVSDEMDSNNRKDKDKLTKQGAKSQSVIPKSLKSTASPHTSTVNSVLPTSSVNVNTSPIVTSNDNISLQATLKKMGTTSSPTNNMPKLDEKADLTKIINSKKPLEISSQIPVSVSLNITVKPLSTTASQQTVHPETINTASSKTSANTKTTTTISKPTSVNTVLPKQTPTTQGNNRNTPKTISSTSPKVSTTTSAGFTPYNKGKQQNNLSGKLNSTEMQSSVKALSTTSPASLTTDGSTHQATKVLTNKPLTAAKTSTASTKVGSTPKFDSNAKIETTPKTSSISKAPTKASTGTSSTISESRTDSSTNATGAKGNASSMGSKEIGQKPKVEILEADSGTATTAKSKSKSMSGASASALSSTSGTEKKTEKNKRND